MSAVGYDLADPGVIPTLELRNITVQAFYKEKISESKTAIMSLDIMCVCMSNCTFCGMSIKSTIKIMAL